MTTSNKPKVLMIGNPEHALDKYEELKEIIDFVELAQNYQDESVVEYREALKVHGSFIGVVFAVRFDKPMPYPLNEKLLSDLVASGLKFVTGPGAGYDRVDVSYLTKKNVFYANNPTSVGQRTADSTVTMILMATRGTSEQERHMREGKFMDRTLRAIDQRVSTLGIIGLGSIGLKVADAMSYLGMKVIYSKRKALSAEEAHGHTFVTLEELYAKADVVCVMCPLTEETKNLINKDSIAKMKDGVIVVNTARGPIVNEDDILDALDSGKVLRLAADVHVNEPNPSERLLKSTKTILTPHSAWYNDTLMKEGQTELLTNLENFVKTGKPTTPVNLV